MKPWRHWLGIAAAVVLGAAACAHSRGEAPLDEAAEQHYYLRAVSLLSNPAQLDSSDAAGLEALDFTRLRRARSLGATQAELATASSLGDKLGQARSAGDGRSSLHIADELLATDFTDVVAHLEKARVLHFGHGGEATFHEAIARALLQSIFADYTSEDPGRPVRVYSRREENAVLEFLDLTPLPDPDTPAATMSQLGRASNLAITCRDRQGRPHVVRFERANLRAPSGH